MIRSLRWALFWGAAMSGGGKSRLTRRVVAALAALLGACAGAPSDPTAAMPPAVVEAATVAWLDAGHQPPACVAPRVLHVDFERFAAECGKPSCADPAVSTDTAVCAHACTWIDLDPAASVVFYAGAATAASGREAESTTRVMAHEVFHAWRDCTYGEPDHGHQHAETWITAMEHVQ